MIKRMRRTQPYGWARDPKLRDPRTSAIGRAAEQARTELAESAPLQSLKKPAGRIMVTLMIMLVMATLLGAFPMPDAWPDLSIVWICTSFLFAALGILRVLACCVPWRPNTFVDDGVTLEAVPIWTIIVALYNEADSVPSLLKSLDELEWAKDRLDVIFACEFDDFETLRILSAFQRRYDFRIVRVPTGGPRTKPNALQTALAFARGRFLTVYDAEDRPDPQQLRVAFQAFLDGPPNLAVVQAPLVAWNHNESWIAGQFALDYAIWFRVMLPAFAHVSGLIPLGGTSNHFRTDVLRDVGGWDPFNVTEDADLGVRLGRRGYRANLISPPTFEEAPPKITSWVKQRGRWIQGHIQTFSMHLRAPIALWRDLGWRGIIAFLIGLGIGPMSALIVLPFGIGLTYSAFSPERHGMWIPIIIGILGHILAACVACHRDGRWTLMTSVLTLPLYHCLQSFAACRAMWRVVFTPSIWDKTEHGCAARWQKVKGKSAWISFRP